MINQSKSIIHSLLPKSGFARGVGVLVGGTAGAQILLVLAAPVLTRLYTPEDFGLLAVYASLLALIGVLASLRYELAIPLPEDDQEAANVAVLCLVLVAVSSLLTGLLVAFLGQPIAHTLGVPQLADYLWLLPVGVLLNGVYNVFNYWSIRTKRFTTIAGTKLRQAVATLAIQLTAFKLGGIALLVAQIAGQGVGTTSLARPALSKPEFKQVSSEGIKQVAIRYQRFPKFSTWASLVNTAGHQLPPILFAAFFTVGAAGLYALAHRILTLPTTLIGGAIGDVFFSHAADAHRENRLGELYLKLQDTLIQIGLPPAMILVVAGSDLFALVFGEAWREAGVFSQWLAISIFAGFVVSPLSQVFIVLEKQKTGLILQTVLFTARLIAISIGIWQESLLLTVALFSLASLLGYSVYLFFGTKYTGNQIKNIFKSLFNSCLFSFLISTPIFLSFLFDVEFVFFIALFSAGFLFSIRCHMIIKSSITQIN